MARVIWICLVLMSTTVAAAQSEEKLAKPCPLSVGQVVALALPQIFVVTGPSGLPVLTAYDKPSETVMVFVYGGQYLSSVDEGKKALEKYREKLTGSVAKLVEGIYGVKLEDTDFTLVYYSNGKEIVRREGGQYVIK